MSGDASTQSTKWKPIVWTLKEGEAEKAKENEVGPFRGSSPSALRQPENKVARSRSRSPRQAPDNSEGPSAKGVGEDLRWNSARGAGRREEHDRRRSARHDLRRTNSSQRQRHEAYPDRDPSASRRSEKFRSKEDEQDSLDSDLRARAPSWSRSDDQGRVHRQTEAADKDLVDLSYEEYLAVFGQVQDAWRKRKLELTFINSQMSAGPG